MVGQQPRRRCWPCRLMILSVCTSIPSQANLGDYYRVLKRLHKCEDSDVPRQAGVHLLRSNIPPAEGGVLVLRGICVLRLLQYRRTPIRPRRTGIRNGEDILPVLCVSHFTAGDSLTQGARTSTVSLSHPSVSGGRDDLLQSTNNTEPERQSSICWTRRHGAIDDNTEREQQNGICWTRRTGAIDDNTIPTRPPTTARVSRRQRPPQ